VISDEADARERILLATVALLNEEQDPERLTVRQIAARAGVAVGAINYHYQSRDRLLNEAVNTLMREEADRWSAAAEADEADPEARLRALLRQTALIGLRYPRLLEVSVRYELAQGRFSVAEMILPLLRAIAPRAGETRLRLTAVQLVASLQIMFLRRDEIRRFAGVDAGEERQLDLILDTLLDNTLCGLGRA
jgi:AcrR family transcriptional regulator